LLVLHGAPSERGLILWAETSDPPPPEPSPRRRAKKVELPPPPAAGAAIEDLVEAVSAVLPELPGEGGSAIAWLPSVDGAPVPSTPLLGESNGKKARIAPWTVETIALNFNDALDLLIDAVGKTLLAPGVLVGADLAFCTTAMRFAAAVVAREHLLPSVDGSSARWLPAFTAHEMQHLASLARAMPPVALAIGSTSDAPPLVSAADATRSFVAGLTDRFVRRAIRAMPPPRGESIHDRWMAALRSDDGAIDANAGDVARLQAAIADWSRPVTAAAELPFRVAFRLEEPGEDEARWTIRYLLQGIDDPSLFVPAKVVWGGKGGTGLEGRALTLLTGTDRAATREVLLRSLGQAAALSGAVEASLRQRAPDAASVDTTAAYRFLSEEAPALESAGFAVYLPSWWSRRGTRQRLSLRGEARAPKFAAKGGLSLAALVDVEWRVALGDQTLTENELAALAKMKEPLVRIRGQWVQLTPAEIEEALRFWRNKGSMTVRDLVRLRLGASSGVLPIDAIDGDGDLGELLGRLDGSRQWQELPPPPGFTGELRPYQARGFSWLDFLKDVGLGACLADDMGLGKTVQTLALLQKEWLAGRGPVLLIAPTSVTGNWIREAARFTPALPTMLHHGSDRMRGDDFVKAARRSALVVSSYALLHREVEALQRVTWKGLILDEAQNIKNAETKQAKAARAIDAPFRIALTGTPVENNVGDLWSIMELLNPGFLGTQASFRQRFFIPIQTRRDPDAVAQLKRLTTPFILRRLKTDPSIISDLPQKNEMKVFCTLTREQASLYRAVVDDAASDLEKAVGMKRKGLVLATLMKLKQVCNHPAQFLSDGSPVLHRSGKLDRLTEMLDEAIEADDRSLVFTQFAEMGFLLQRHLQESFGREALFLHGGTPRKQRDAMIERFQQASAGPPVFVLSLKAGGTGLNLTRASHVFHFDRWWNPAVENQATDRAFRIGQTRNVQVHKFVCGGTVEEKIDQMIEGKKELASSVVGSGEGWLTELSNAELRDLFALRADAVGE
jgi:SNF2 family DNA or RNA helicase